MLEFIDVSKISSNEIKLLRQQAGFSVKLKIRKEDVMSRTKGVLKNDKVY